MSTKKPKSVSAHCPSCNGSRNCAVHGVIDKPWHWEDRKGNSMNGGVKHSLLECLGCNEVFYESTSWDSEDLDYWYDEDGDTQSEPNLKKVTYPAPETATEPKWLDALQRFDSLLHRIMAQSYTSYESKAFILTAVGLRAGFDRAIEVLGVDPSLDFKSKLSALRDNGWIGDRERDVLEVVTEAGSAAAHRGWSPSAKDVKHLMEAMEAFLYRAVIIGAKALEIKPAIPTKPRRPKALKHQPPSQDGL